MRYYSIVITNPDTGSVLGLDPIGGTFVPTNAGSTFTSFVRGRTDPGALNVEFDLPVVPMHTPQGQGILRVWGIPLQALGRASDLNGKNIQLFAGMQQGLPLANPTQKTPIRAGLILDAQIYQAYGNWQGVNQTLDLICFAQNIQPTQNISFLWPAGEPLALAIQTALVQAFPKYTPSVQITALVPPNDHDQAGTYPSLQSFAQYINDISQQANTAQGGDASYTGVAIVLRGQTIYVTDTTVAGSYKTVQIEFQDLIGQPTWISPIEISFKTVLRPDINPFDRIILPSNIISPYALTTPAAAVPNAPSRSRLAFTGGPFIVNELHFFANFRQPDADSWNTSIKAAFLSPP